MGIYLDNILYIYIGICGILLVYDAFFLLYSRLQKWIYDKYSKVFYKEIKKQLFNLREGREVDPSHKNDLVSKLVGINKLFAYSSVLDNLREEGQDLDPYLKEIYRPIKELAYKYKIKEAYHKAFFAFFVSKNPPCQGEEYNSLMKTLLSYLEEADVYSRENVLRALYSLGNIQAVENALEIINRNDFFHHKKLISDGLMEFSGDKEELAEELWRSAGKWSENLLLSLIKFISMASDNFKERFFKMLLSGQMGLEAEIEMLRYFQNHHYEPMGKLLQDNLNEDLDLDKNIKIVSASVLGKYPGRDSEDALIKVLGDSNWYLRNNALKSLERLGVNRERYEKFLTNNEGGEFLAKG